LQFSATVKRTGSILFIDIGILNWLCSGLILGAMQRPFATSEHNQLIVVARSDEYFHPSLFLFNNICKTNLFQDLHIFARIGTAKLEPHLISGQPAISM
jgi:hypothetical protein